MSDNAASKKKGLKRKNEPRAEADRKTIGGKGWKLARESSRQKKRPGLQKNKLTSADRTNREMWGGKAHKKKARFNIPSKLKQHTIRGRGKGQTSSGKLSKKGLVEQKAQGDKGTT